MERDLGKHYLENATSEFLKLKSLGDKALAQVTDAELFIALDQEANSIAVIIKHISGNQSSRWTDFLTSDGEKPDRHRDREFEMRGDETRASIMKRWEEGWQCLFRALEPLRGEDLLQPVVIRGEPHTVVQAINRQLAHYAGHVGQIVFLAKHLKAGEWKSLSIPRGKSAEFNAAMGAAQKGAARVPHE